MKAELKNSSQQETKMFTELTSTIPPIVLYLSIYIALLSQCPSETLLTTALTLCRS